ncbi:hypothetical protein [Massilia antarctica]|uniref:hypothetical protein n=1 Tax=Massilia antarctica TaxID=2765360 RepID=UPI002271E376|nr:hypothetical protein [Massilia sp. H27-R4]MCY0914882.1 hypothetical protein [Massilia sp. H27-R4]
MFFASRHPELTRSLTSVEGNFTLKDAFWSSQIAQMALSGVEAMVDGYKSDVGGWISAANVAPTPWALDVAQRWLHNQPASTVRAQARAVVAATGRAQYLDMVRSLLETGAPFHLIGGARSRPGWDVPDWVARIATSNSDLAATGHLMMLEASERFAGAIMSNCRV